MEPSHDTGVRIVRSRVTIDNFNLPAQEISKLWAEQENYVDLLETKLRQASQQDQLLKSKLLNKNRKLANTNAQLEKLKVSRASELSHLENGWVCNKCYCQALNTKEICQFPSCTSSNLSPSNIRRVCTNCFTRNLTTMFPCQAVRRELTRVQLLCIISTGLHSVRYRPDLLTSAPVQSKVPLSLPRLNLTICSFRCSGHPPTHLHQQPRDSVGQSGLLLSPGVAGPQLFLMM